MECTNLALRKKRQAKRIANRITIRSEQEAKVSTSDLRMTEKEYQRRLRAVEGM
jgi:hypothetical protein